MRNPANAISQHSQSPGVKGWVYQGKRGGQMAYWECYRDSASQQHSHDYDEYVIVAAGEFSLLIEGKKLVLCQGDEYLIPARVPHAAEFVAGTRTIHCFGGKRAELQNN